jgi:hypothetical protein
MSFAIRQLLLENPPTTDRTLAVFAEATSSAIMVSAALGSIVKTPYSENAPQMFTAVFAGNGIYNITAAYYHHRVSRGFAAFFGVNPSLDKIAHNLITGATMITTSIATYSTMVNNDGQASSYALGVGSTALAGVYQWTRAGTMRLPASVQVEEIVEDEEKADLPSPAQNSESSSYEAPALRSEAAASVSNSDAVVLNISREAVVVESISNNADVAPVIHSTKTSLSSSSPRNSAGILQSLNAPGGSGNFSQKVADSVSTDYPAAIITDSAQVVARTVVIPSHVLEAPVPTTTSEASRRLSF